MKGERRQPMVNKIAVIGCSGSGKSTLSRKWGELCGLPVYHLDASFWKPGWVMTPAEQWDRHTEELVRNGKWIIDGNYSRTIERRIAAADTIVFFDLPRYLCLYRIFKRRIMYHKKSRPDMGEGCAEKVDWTFVKYVWNFKKKNRPKIIALLDAYSDRKNIVILRSRRMVAEYIEQIKKSV